MQLDWRTIFTEQLFSYKSIGSNLATVMKISIHLKTR